MTIEQHIAFVSMWLTFGGVFWYAAFLFTLPWRRWGLVLSTVLALVVTIALVALTWN